ncbi:MAG: class I SAM-dependent methyltransferase [Chloroflexota bacterium]
MNPIEKFYNQDDHVEWERLDHHRTEFAVTMRAIQEFLPSPPAKILDVGGGPGRYAIALAQQGHIVSLCDLSQASLVRAEERAKAANVQLQEILPCNAVDLPHFVDSAYDALLLLGPLYHLIDSAERQAALQEAYRVLKSGGLIFAAFLTKYSALRVCADRFPKWLAANPDYAERIITTGVHQGEWGFTTAYHVHPDEVEPLMEGAGFNSIQVVSCEGLGAHTEENLNQLTGADWEWWADLNYRLGKDSALHGAATHLLYVGHKE